MTLISRGLDSIQASPLDAQIPFNAADVRTAQNADGYRAATTASGAGTAEAHLGAVTLVDGGKCEQPKGFWTRLGESWGKAMIAQSYAEAGMVPPDDAPAKACATDVSPAKPAAQVPLDRSSDTAHSAQAAPDRGAAIKVEPPAGAMELVVPPADAKGLVVPPSDAKGPVAPPSDAKGPVEPPAVHLDLSIPGQGAEPKDQTDTSGQTDRKAGQEQLNPLLKGVLDNIGKHVEEIEPGINPRLGCVRMVAHAMHIADPSFPETNNAAAFRKALKEHGYEEVTVKPGDPALGHSHAGDVLVGRRPDGMPSHAAINMGDGTVFNNNSDSGKGQIDKLDQFNQGMHDSKGHWMKNGFSAVTIYRKTDHAPKTSTTDDTV